MIGAGAAIDGLVEVIAHREIVREKLEVGHIALLNVVKTEGGRTFTRSYGRARRPFCAEVCRQWQAVEFLRGAGSGSYFDPREQLGVATGRILETRVLQAAIQLLPHLVEAMDRTCRIRVIRKTATVR